MTVIGHTFVDDIHNIDEVVECYNVSGDYDFLLKVHAGDMKHYQDLFSTNWDHLPVSEIHIVLL
jgi:DNA-binding Lrp family transcriptional regulator